MDQLQRTLETIDYLLMTAGGLMLIVFIYRRRRDRWRDPLRGAPMRPCNLTPLVLWVVIAINLSGWFLGDRLGALITPQTLSDDSQVSWQGILSAAMTQLLMLITCPIVAHYTFTARLKGLGIGRRPIVSDIHTALVGLLVSICICGLILLAGEKIVELIKYTPPLHSVYKTLREPDTGPWMRNFAIFGAFLLAPIGEELFFRGILQTGIKKLIPPRSGSMRHRWTALVLVAVLFGTMHSTMPHHIPALIVLGVILGYLYERTGSLIVPIIIHMLFNGKSLLWHQLQMWFIN